MSKKYLRTAQVAARYACHVRTVPRMVKDKRIPPPYYFGTRFPKWAEDELDENDRQVAKRPRPVPAPQPAEVAP
jgi:predicted DNA-binding transcriptional regulator AlpA